jgi:hypothetical protein
VAANEPGSNGRYGDISDIPGPSGCAVPSNCATDPAIPITNHQAAPAVSTTIASTGHSGRRASPAIIRPDRSSRSKRPSSGSVFARGVNMRQKIPWSSFVWGCKGWINQMAIANDD